MFSRLQPVLIIPLDYIINHMSAQQGL